MDKHPFFMKKMPEPGDEIHPMLEGIQQLKYDPDENTSEDLANNYKDDGTFYMKHKKFRMAVLGYTEGLKVKCENPEINAALYNNRSAANFFLENYRSSMTDCDHALKLKPDYTKAKWRAALCAKHLKKHDSCIKYCDMVLKDDPKHTEALALKRQSIKDTLTEKAKEQTIKHNETMKINEINKLLAVIQKRGIKFEGYKPNTELKEVFITPAFDPLLNSRVSISEEGGLVWPAVICYPEFLISDFLEKVHDKDV